MIDDVAKLTTPLQHGSQHQGLLLSAMQLAEALYHTKVRGLPSGHTNRFGEGRYHLSVWSVPYRPATGCVFQIPYRLGDGGNLVVLLPNGISAFRFADGHDYTVDTMVLAGEALRPFPCPAGSPENPRECPASRGAWEHPLRTPCDHLSGVLWRAPHHVWSADGSLYGTFTSESTTERRHP